MNDTQGLFGIRVAVVVVNWNGWRECIECIDSLYAQSHRNFHIFLVDNCSSDNSPEHIKNWCAEPKAAVNWRQQAGVRRLTDQPFPSPVTYRIIEGADRSLPPASDDCKLTIICCAQNAGFAAGCNVGIRAGGLQNFDYFWLLNPDTLVAHDALLEVIRRAESDPAIGMVGSTLLYYDRPEVVQSMGGARLNERNGTSWHIGQGEPLDTVPLDGSAVEAEMAYVVGASMLVSERYIAEIGFLEEDYFLYFEEIDWALRGRDKFLLGYAPKSHVFHKSGANSSKVVPLFSAGFYYRNRLRFVRRFLPDQLAAAKRSLIEQMLRHIVKGRWRHACVVGQTLLMAERITASVNPRPAPSKS